jgi:hypothetical protein
MEEGSGHQSGGSAGSFSRDFTDGRITGTAHYDDGELARVEASSGSTHLVLSASRGWPSFRITDEADGEFEMFGGRGTGGKFLLALRGLNQGALANSILLLENVVKPFLSLLGVTEIVGFTPNESLAKLFRDKCGASFTDHTPMLTDALNYEIGAGHGVYDPQFIKGPWFKVLIPVPQLKEYQGFTR